MSGTWSKVLDIEDGAIGYYNSREFRPIYKKETRDQIRNFMLASAIVATVVFFINVVYF